MHWINEGQRAADRSCSGSWVDIEREETEMIRKCSRALSHVGCGFFTHMLRSPAILAIRHCCVSRDARRTCGRLNSLLAGVVLYVCFVGPPPGIVAGNRPVGFCCFPHSAQHLPAQKALLYEVHACLSFKALSHACSISLTQAISFLTLSYAAQALFYL